MSVGLKRSAAVAATCCAARTLPVKATVWVCGCETSACPVTAPPVRTCTSPRGRWSKASIHISNVTGVSSDGLMITAFPAASAAAACQPASSIGKLYGTMETATPSGSLSTICSWPAIAGPATRPASLRAISA